jgi:1-deoxy-D-xylulose-5-phosphate reductoisomerase
MILFTDGSVKIQAAAPDMRLPIGYALAYPDRLDDTPSTSSGVVRPAHHGDALVAAGAHPEATALRYDFERPDAERFPCVALAYRALQAGGTMPAVLSAANEIAVSAFVEGEIRFGQIPQVIERAMAAAGHEALTLEGVREADRDARKHAGEAITELRSGIEV